MTVPAYGQAISNWRAKAEPDWNRYTCHAFVEGLGSGGLPRSAYLHYLQQDYVFLMHFSRAWALAAVKACNSQEMAIASATLHALIHVELPLHVTTCASAGIDRTALEATAELPENLAYTRYVLETGYSGDFLDLLAALAPCVLGYGEIGLRLKGTTGPYADWCETYSGPEYQTLCHDVGTLIDGAIERRLGKDWAELPKARMLADTFATATRLEVGFWDMALRGPVR